MSNWENAAALQTKLSGLRIGTVPFLNTRPLTWGATGWGAEEPVRLAEDLRLSRYDIALVPIFECLSCPGYRWVDGAGIASTGAVASVLITGVEQIDGLKRVAQDPGSYTSHHLMRVLLELGLLGASVVPEYVAYGEKADAALLIGDRALQWKRQNPMAKCIDLGEVWKLVTGLPFVYAVWAIRPGISLNVAIEAAEVLRQMATLGVQSIDEMTADKAERYYLRHNISYSIGEAEKRGVERYAEFLVRLRVLNQIPSVEWI